MYIILEIQTTNGVPATLVHKANSYNEAQSVYHTVLAAAAISSIECHAATLLDYHGNALAAEYYTHTIISEGESNG